MQYTHVHNAMQGPATVGQAPAWPATAHWLSHEACWALSLSSGLDLHACLHAHAKPKDDMALLKSAYPCMAFAMHVAPACASQHLHAHVVGSTGHSQELHACVFTC